MTMPTTAQRLIDFRKELANSGQGFGAELLHEILRDAAKAIIQADGLVTHPDLAHWGTPKALPRSSEGVGESKSPA
ncbi:hypothetical protein [Streptomyces sp. NBC_01314]|uniref:hypothetical protein n=1 Tax=Streptomyces sp. NBC_01314 TaxID=2903821 RepID=UPI0030871132|nr:hypothetical protein OG622_28550 [Streptomyces sp. NBC_01314]